MTISVFLADDNIIVREGVKALLQLAPDLELVGEAQDYESLVDEAGRLAPQVVVTDIRMPPTFTREGIDAGKELRRLHPGTGVVVLSQYDDPAYAVCLLAEGASGFAYLLKDRVGEGDQLARAVREVATGGSMLDPRIVEALISPVEESADLTPGEEELLKLVAEGRSIKAIAVMRRTTPAHIADSVERLFVTLAKETSRGTAAALQHLKMLHLAIVQREEQGESLSRLVPTGIAEKLRREGRRAGETEMLEVTVLMSDVRGYTTIAEDADPAVLARQLNEHRAAMNQAVLAQDGTIMQFVGDAVMAVFGAPFPRPDHPDQAVAAANSMHLAQAEVNRRWAGEGLPAFGLGIGLSTGRVAAAILGSDERLEYSVVGDTVNLTQRLQGWAKSGETVLSEPTYAALTTSLLEAERIEPALVKGRERPVAAYRLAAGVSRGRRIRDGATDQGHDGSHASGIDDSGGA